MRTILVVEDDLTTQILIKYYIGDEFKLINAGSVDAAKKILSEKLIDLILLDLSLTGEEDGLDLARFIRQNQKYQGLPIIATTAHAFTTDFKNSIEAGCNEFLTKPFNQTHLKNLIHKVLPDRSTGRSFQADHSQ